MQLHLSPRPNWLAAGALTLVTAAVAPFLLPFMEPAIALLWFLAVVAVSAWLGGIRSGLIATAAGAALLIFYSLALSSEAAIVHVLAFVLVALLITVMQSGRITLFNSPPAYAEPARLNQAERLTLMASPQKTHEERLRMVIENMPIMLSATGDDDTLILWNREAERVTGYSEAEMLHEPHFTHILQPDPLKAAAIEALADQMQHNFRDWEIPFVRKDGKEIITLWSNISTEYPVPGWSDWAVGIDITERKQAEKRTALLQGVTAALSEAITPQHVAEVILDHALSALNAVAGWVVLLSEDGEYREMIYSVGHTLDEQNHFRRKPVSYRSPVGDAVATGRSIWLEKPEDRDALYPDLHKNFDVTRKAWVALPLSANGRTFGAIGLSFAEPCTFSEQDKAFGMAIAQQCAQAMERARLYEAERRMRVQYEAANRRLAFLADASALLASSLDYEITLSSVADMLVPTMGDWCAVDMLTETGKIERLAVAHVDPERVKWAYEINRRYPPNPEATSGLVNVLRTGQPEMISEVTEEMIQAAVKASPTPEETLRLLREINFSSVLIVPLIARGRVLGAITLVWSDSRYHYNHADLQFAQELASRASLAVDNASLYRESTAQSERLRVTLASIGEAVIATDTDGLVTFMNPTAIALTGWYTLEPRPHIEQVFRLVDSQHQPAENPFQQVMREEDVTGLSTPMLLRAMNSRLTHVDYNGAPIRDENGELVGVIIVFRDISDRIRAENEIRLYADIVKNTQIGLVVWQQSDPTDLQSLVMVAANPASSRITQLPNHEYIGKTVQSVFPEMFDAPHGQAMLDVLRTGVPVDISEVNSTRTDFLANRFYTVKIFPLPNHAVGVAFDDITELKLTQEQLARALSQTRDLYEVTRRISMVRTPGEIVNALLQSAAFAHVKQVCVDIFDTPYLPGKPPKFFIKVATHLPENGLPVPLNVPIPLEKHPYSPFFRRDEPVIMFDAPNDPRLSQSIRDYIKASGVRSLIIFPLIAGGEWYGIISVQSADPHQWQPEDVVSMQHHVDQVAVTIDNYRLLQREANARREAEQADRLKLNFLAMISHELRTPLTSIKGFATTMLAEDVNWDIESQHSFIEIINDEADKLTDLIEQLLDLSRLEAGKLSIHPSVQTLDAVMVSAAAQIETLTRKHEFRLDIQPDLPSVSVDTQRIGQVLVNLVGNAAKYSPDDTLITLRAYREGRFIRVDVTDHGIGIPQAERLVVFEAFRQAELRGQMPAKGAGLGLAICKGLVEAHGGRIWVVDNDVPGTTVSFTLPIHSA